MDFWIRAAQLMLSLSILVILHELGHYIPAVLFKTRVEKFYLFFDPWFSLFKKKIGDTEWGIGWLPLGGYVKISGMVDESMDKEQLKEPAKPWEFRSKPAWQRLIIMLGGVTVNLFLGIFIYILVVFAYGVETIDSKDLKAGLSVHPFMEQYGFKSGDVILAVNGKKLDKATDANVELLIRGGQQFEVKHQDGKVEIIKLPEGTDYKVFEEGAFPAFSLRMSRGKIKHIVSTTDWKNGSDEVIKAGDVFHSLLGKKLDENSDVLNSVSGKSLISFEIIRATDTLKKQVSEKEFNEKVLPVFPTLQAGLKLGDLIFGIEGQEINYHDEITSTLYKNKSKKVNLQVLRGNDTLLIDAKVSKKGTLGFMHDNIEYVDKAAIKTSYLSFGESISKGWNMGFITLSDYVGQMKFLFTKKGASSMGGFGSIGKLFPTTWDWQIFWMNTAFISIVLAFMNILPIPALDGGHVVFLLYEIITGREAPQKVLEYAQYVGFILLISLLLYANGNDIYNAFFK
jgi:regulator of sigma E protease